MAGEDDAARGRRIRERREHLGYTLEDVAACPIDPIGRTVGADPSTIAEWEAGADPGKAKLERLAAALRTSWRCLAYGDEDTGTRIAQLRFERGMTQADLAKAVGAATQGPSNSRTVQVWESAGGVQIRDETLTRIADALGTSRSYLLTGREGDGPEDELERRRGSAMRPATKGELSGLREEFEAKLEEQARALAALRRRIASLERAGNSGQRRQAPPATENH